MTSTYLVTLDYDPSRAEFTHTMELEMRTHLESLGGVKSARVLRPESGELAPTLTVRQLIRALRQSLHFYAHSDKGWAHAVHANVYEASRELVSDDEEERAGLNSLTDEGRTR